MNKKCLIVGISGQTGAYLSKELIKNNFEVIGSSRDAVNINLKNFELLGVNLNDIEIISLDPSDPRQVFSVLLKYKPDRIYNLAGQTSVSLSFQQPSQAIDSISNSCLNFLEAIRSIDFTTRYFNAGSSECFGDTLGCPANESTLHKPNSPYAVAKSSAIHLTRIAREAYGIHSCTGILSNHESPLRSERFVTKKIVNDLKKIKKGKLRYLKLGNLNVIRDWGWASEYAKAIYIILEHRNPDDYVVATGESNSLTDFVKRSCDILDLDFDDVVLIDERFKRPLDLSKSFLDPEKIYKKLGWKANIKFDKIVNKLINEEYF